MDITTLSDEELKQLVIDLGIDFDWDKWLSPRYKLIEIIKQDERLNALSIAMYTVLTVGSINLLILLY